MKNTTFKTFSRLFSLSLSPALAKIGHY